MANKNKVELTPEELAAKKIRKSNGWVRFWAILLAFVLTIGLFKTTMSFGDKITKASVAAGGSNSSEETTDADDANSDDAEETTESTTKGTGTDSAATTVAGDKKPAGGSGTAATTKAPVDTKKAEAVAYYNTALNKAKKSAKKVDVDNSNKVVKIGGVGAFGGIVTKLTDQFLKPGKWGLDPIKVPPADAQAEVKLEWLSNATMTEAGGKVTVKIFLKKEGNNPQPGKSNHGKTIDTLKDDDIMNAINGTKIVKLLSFKTTYQNCTSELVVDKATGNLITMKQHRSIDAKADTNLIKNLSATIDSEYNYTFTF
ncbi:MAG: hypothetical protein RR355_04750 [Oscillospiraceae bacterium]